MDNSFLNSTLGKVLTRQFQYQQPEEAQQEDISQEEDDDSYDFKNTALDKASSYIEKHDYLSKSAIIEKASNDVFWGRIDTETKDWIEKLTVEE